MENRTPADELLTTAMTTDSSIQRLATVYEAMRRNSEGNPLLASYHDFDTIRDNIIVLHGTENERDYLVYNDQHPKAGQEVHFDIAGYICSFNLPGNSVTTRLFHRPHSLKQRVTLVAYSSDEFQRSLEGLASLAAYLNQYAIDGNAMPPKERNAFGMPAIAAETNLFTYRQLEMEFEEMDFPSNLDPSGRIMAEVRRRSFCYTTDNAVEYSEIALDRPDCLQGNICLSEKFAVEPGVFRHGQLVTMSVAIRSARRKADPRFPNVTRGVDIRIKGLTLVDREVEMSLVKLRQEDERQRVSHNANKVKHTRKPVKQSKPKLLSREEFVRNRMESMALDDSHTMPL